MIQQLAILTGCDARSPACPWPTATGHCLPGQSGVGFLADSPRSGGAEGGIHMDDGIRQAPCLPAMETARACDR